MTGTLKVQDQLTVQDTDTTQDVSSFLFGAHDDPLNPGTLIGGMEMQYDVDGNLDFILRKKPSTWTWWAANPNGTGADEVMKLTASGALSVGNIELISDPNGTHSKIRIDSTEVLTQSESGDVRWGGDNTFSGGGSTAWGQSTNAVGQFSTAWGENSIADGELSTTWGAGSLASGFGSTSWGSSTAAGYFASAWGANTNAGGVLSTAWGQNANATDYLSTAWGESTASGYGSTSWGNGTASGNWSTSWSSYGESIGDWATSWGFESIASGRVSTAFGEKVTARTHASLAFGAYNVGIPSKIPTGHSWWISSPEDSVLEIGNGGLDDVTWVATHSNAVTVFRSGDMHVGGKVQAKHGVRVPEQGDLSMGAFTAGQDPADLDPELGLLYPQQQ